jgi:hypothetical protein
MSFALNNLLNVRKRPGREENDTLHVEAVNGIRAGNIALTERRTVPQRLRAP